MKKLNDHNLNIVVTDETQQLKASFIHLFNVGEVSYAALSHYENYYILRVRMTDKGEVLENISSEEEFERAYHTFKTEYLDNQYK